MISALRKWFAPKPIYSLMPDVGPIAEFKGIKGDGYGYKTANNDIPIVRVVPPVVGRYSRAHMLQYDCSTTAHIVTFMVPLGETYLTADVAANGTTLPLAAPLPQDLSGGSIASPDWLVLFGADGFIDAYKVSSLSSLVVSIVTTIYIGSANGTGIRSAAYKGYRVWFMGQPSDHPDRQYRMKASTVTNLYDGISGLATTPKMYQPILVHSDNATAAAGSMQGPTYTNPVLSNN